MNVFTAQVSNEHMIQLPKQRPGLVFGPPSGPVVRLQFEPEISVILADGATWDDAAKAFWNGVHTVMGLPAPFAECPQERAAADWKALLTPQQTDVAGYIAEGYCDREIAALMGYSDVNVRQHVKNIRRLLGATNRTQVALIVKTGARPASMGVAA